MTKRERVFKKTIAHYLQSEGTSKHFLVSAPTNQEMFKNYNKTCYSSELANFPNCHEYVHKCKIIAEGPFFFVLALRFHVAVTMTAIVFYCYQRLYTLLPRALWKCGTCIRRALRWGI